MKGDLLIIILEQQAQTIAPDTPDLKPNEPEHTIKEMLEITKP